MIEIEFFYIVYVNRQVDVDECLPATTGGRCVTMISITFQMPNTFDYIFLHSSCCCRSNLIAFA